MQFAGDPTIRFFVAEGGLALVRIVVDEAELLTIAVEPSRRRKGVATALLARIEQVLRDCGVASCFLEVEADNEAAIALYRRFHFNPCSIREGYYLRGERRVDAILMQRSFKEV